MSTSNLSFQGGLLKLPRGGGEEKIFRVEYEPDGDGKVQPKNPLGEGYTYFLEQHNTLEHNHTRQ